MSPRPHPPWLVHANNHERGTQTGIACESHICVHVTIRNQRDTIKSRNLSASRNTANIEIYSNMLSTAVPMPTAPAFSRSRYR
jgi:hypothetical protein